jgi:Tfp pilus assembly protein PilO
MKLNAPVIGGFLRTNALLAGTAAGMVVLLLAVYLPKLSNLRAVKREFEKSAADLCAHHELIDRLVEIGAQHQAVKVELEQARREHAGQHRIPEMLHALTAASADLDFNLRTINRSAQEKQRFFIKVPLELHADASYRSFAEYLDRISRVAKLLDIRRVEIAASDETYPRHAMKLVVDAYFLEETGEVK